MSQRMNRNGQLTSDHKMIEGVQKFLSKFASLPVGSQNRTPADMVKVFQDRIDTANAASAAAAARSAAVKVSRDTRKETAAFVSSLRRMVQGMFSQSPDTLAAFGLKPPKASKTTVVTKATALAKSTATRKARNTMGSKQRKAVKGTAQPATSGTATAPATQPTKPNA